MIIPGWTVTDFFSWFKSITLRMYFEKSNTIEFPTVDPAKLVPPPLGRIET